MDNFIFLYNRAMEIRNNLTILSMISRQYILKSYLQHVFAIFLFCWLKWQKMIKILNQRRLAHVLIFALSAALY